MNFRLALRLMFKNKVDTTVNLLGLAVGLACVLLIGLYIRHESSFDRYHENADQIYRLANMVEGSTYEDGIAKVSAPWGPNSVETVPEIEDMCRFVFFGESLFEQGEQRFYENDGLFADASVFDVFSWQLREGDPATALTEPNTIVLDANIAAKYFGDTNPMGQTIRIDNSEEYRVTGILEPIPDNSHFHFDFLASLVSYSHPDMEEWNRWNQFYTYLVLDEEADAGAVAVKVDQLLDRHLPEDEAAAVMPLLQPITDIHLHSQLHREIEANSDARYLYIFGAIAAFILLIACFNFINLTTARGAQRAHEIGVRKASGAGRGVLVRQFLAETFVFGMLAMVFAVLVANLTLPGLNTFLGREMAFNWLQDPSWSLGLLLITALVALLAGIYPAFFLTRYEPSRTLRGHQSSTGNASLRKALVVLQFSLAIILIFGAMVVSGQLDFIQQKNLGFNKEQVLVLPMPTAEERENIMRIKEQLAEVPGVVSASASANRPGGSDFGVPYEAVGLAPENQPPMRCLTVDHDFLDTYQMEMASGRGFDQAFATDTAAFLINEAAAKQLGWNNPLEEQLAMPAIDRESGPIVGVVKDFHFRSLEEEITPLYIFIEQGWFSQVSLRLDAERIPATMAAIEEKWNTLVPAHPFNGFFFDEVYDTLYQSETRLGALVKWLTFLAIFITCLGLFGLSTYTAERRTKEIGIRKVLGATVPQILSMLGKEYIALVAIGLVIGTPIAWYFSQQWLADFAYSIEITWWMPALAGLLAIVVAWLTISYQSLLAALANPVESLRSE